MFDTDEDGYISEAEFRHVMRNSDKNLTDDDIVEMMKEIDSIELRVK